MNPPPAHAVIAGAERRAAVDCDLRHGGAGHRLDHLRAVLDHAGFLVGLADHVAGGVVEIEQRRPRLAPALIKMRPLFAPAGIPLPLMRTNTTPLSLRPS